MGSRLQIRTLITFTAIGKGQVRLFLDFITSEKDALAFALIDIEGAGVEAIVTVS